LSEIIHPISLAFLLDFLDLRGSRELLRLILQNFQDGLRRVICRFVIQVTAPCTRLYARLLLRSRRLRYTAPGESQTRLPPGIYYRHMPVDICLPHCFAVPGVSYRIVASAPLPRLELANISFSPLLNFPTFIIFNSVSYDKVRYKTVGKYRVDEVAMLSVGVH
jgi:hypothetical protein